MELLHLNIIQYWNLLQVQTLIQYATVIMPIVFIHLTTYLHLVGITTLCSDQYEINKVIGLPSGKAVTDP